MPKLGELGLKFEKRKLVENFLFPQFSNFGSFLIFLAGFGWFWLALAGFGSFGSVRVLVSTAYQIIQVSFDTFLTASLLGYNKINLSTVSWSKCFSSPSPIYHKISPNPVG